MKKDKEQIWYRRWMYALVAFIFCVIVSKIFPQTGNPEILANIIVITSGVYSFTIGIVFMVHRRRKYLKWLENELKN